MLLLSLYTMQRMVVGLYRSMVLSSSASLSIACLLVLFILENGLLKHCLTQCSIQQAFGAVLLLSSPLTHIFTAWASSTISPRPGTAPTLPVAVVGEGQHQLFDSHVLRPPGRLTCVPTNRVSSTVHGLLSRVPLLLRGSARYYSKLSQPPQMARGRWGKVRRVRKKKKKEYQKSVSRRICSTYSIYLYKSLKIDKNKEMNVHP